MNIMELLKNKKKDNGSTDNNLSETYLMIEYLTQNGEGIDLYFYVSNEGDGVVSQITKEDIPENTKVYRVTPRDKIISFTKKTAKGGNKKKEFLRASQGKPLVLKALRKNEYYVTNKDLEMIDESKNIRVAPLNILIDRYLNANTENPKLDILNRKQQVVSLVIRSEQIVVVSWVKSKLGDYIKDSFTVNVIEDIDNEDQLRDIVFETLKRKSITIDEEDDRGEYIIIPEVELIDYASVGLKRDTYPVSSEILKLPKTIVAMGSVIVAGGIAFSGFTFNTYMGFELSKTLKEEQRIMDMKPDVTRFRYETIQNHAMFYIGNQNIDFNNSLYAAEQLWLPSTHIQLTQDRRTTRITVKTVDGTNLRTAFDPYLVSQMMKAQEAPEGYSKEPVSSTGSFSSYEVSYVKQ